MGLREEVYAAGTPVLWLELAEASGGTVTNRGSDGGTFTVRGAPVRRVTKLFGPDGAGYTLAPTADKLTRNTGLLVGDVSFSAMVWFRTLSADAVADYADGAVANVLLGDYSGSVGRAFGVHGGVVKYRHYSGVWGGATGTTRIDNGGWHMVGLTYDAATDAVTLYLDAAQEATGTAAANSGTRSFSTVGAGYGDGTEAGALDVFDGSVGPVAAWTGVLSAATFKRLFDAGIRGGVSSPGGFGHDAFGTMPHGGGTGAVLTAAFTADALLTFGAVATGSIRPGGAGTAALVLSASATAGNRANGSAAVGDVTDAATLRFGAFASGEVVVAVQSPPAGSTVAPIKRVSITMPAPVLDSEGRPT